MERSGSKEVDGGIETSEKICLDGGMERIESKVLMAAWKGAKVEELRLRF